MSNLKKLRSKLKNPVVKGSLIYTSAGLINSLIPFLLLPILTDYLNPEQYGILSTFMVLVSVFMLLIGIEQQGYISVNFFKKSKLELSKDIFNSLTISLLIFVILFTLSILFSDLLEDIVKIDYEWILFALMIAFFQFVTQMNLTIWQLKELPTYFGLYQIGYSLINYGVSLVLIIMLSMGESGRIYGIAIAAGIFGFLSIFILIKNRHLTPGFNLKSVMLSLRFCVPLIPHGLAGWINTGLDKVLINNFVSVSENGIYSISYQFAMIIGLIASSFNRAFVPFLYKKLNEKNPENNKILVKYTYLYFLILTIITFLIYFLTPVIMRIFISDDYQDANKYVFWIMMGFLADGFYYGVVNYIYYKKKTYYLSLITFFVAIIHFLLSWMLIPKLGSIAASYATAIGYIISFVLVWIVSNRIHPMPWLAPFKTILKK